MLALVPMNSRLDNGELMLRADPDRPSTTYPMSPRSRPPG